jgi:methylated-DNA-[protein]-cysteine S-methyltransferase
MTRGRRRAPTPFAARVLRVVARIPSGRVATYGDVARLAGRPGAARAVGNILREARLPALPYHRVVAAGGRLGGYGGAPGLKAGLLAAEGVLVRQQRIQAFASHRWGQADS